MWGEAVEDGLEFAEGGRSAAEVECGELQVSGCGLQVGEQVFEDAYNMRDISAAFIFRTSHIRMQRTVRALAAAEREMYVEVHASVFVSAASASEDTSPRVLVPDSNATTSP